jgi:hypothetical protein
MRLKPQENADETATHPTRRGYPIYDENPSVVGRFPVTMRSRSLKNGRQAVMIAPDTGEVLGEGAFGFITEEVVDNERFVKIYLDGIKQHGQLTKAGLLIFEFVYTQISGMQGKDRDTVMLNHYIAQKWKPSLSRATYYRGMNELLDRDFLFRSPAADVYFINVRFMFNGDRMTVVRTYRRKGSADQLHLPLAPKALASAES